MNNRSKHYSTLNVDNQGAINYSMNAINHSRTKHIDIQHHFVHEKLVSNEIEIQYCATENNLADLFTKALPKPRHEDLAKRLGMAEGSRGSVKINGGLPSRTRR